MPKSVNSEREDSIRPSEQRLRDHKKFICSFSFRLKISALETNEKGGQFELGLETKLHRSEMVNRRASNFFQILIGQTYQRSIKHSQRLKDN